MPRCQGAPQEIGTTLHVCVDCAVLRLGLRCSTSLIQESPNWNGEVLVDNHPRGVARVSSLSVGGDSLPLRAEEGEEEVCACRLQYVCMYVQFTTQITIIKCLLKLLSLLMLKAKLS